MLLYLSHLARAAMPVYTLKKLKFSMISEVYMVLKMVMFVNVESIVDIKFIKWYHFAISRPPYLTQDSHSPCNSQNQSPPVLRTKFTLVINAQPHLPSLTTSSITSPRASFAPLTSPTTPSSLSSRLSISSRCRRTSSCSSAFCDCVVCSRALSCD